MMHDNSVFAAGAVVIALLRTTKAAAVGVGVV
jgi:hypothetical protein